MTDWNKVYAFLREEMADPFQKDAAGLLITRIKENKIGIGQVLRHLIKAAETGKFKHDD